MRHCWVVFSCGKHCWEMRSVLFGHHLYFRVQVGVGLPTSLPLVPMSNNSCHLSSVSCYCVSCSRAEDGRISTIHISVKSKKKPNGPKGICVLVKMGSRYIFVEMKNTPIEIHKLKMSVVIIQTEWPFWNIPGLLLSLTIPAGSADISSFSTNNKWMPWRSCFLYFSSLILSLRLCNIVGTHGLCPSVHSNNYLRK